METTQQVHGAVRIGRGEKLHPAYKVVKADGKHEMFIRCSCPGTQQGRAYNKATFYAGVQRTCRG